MYTKIVNSKKNTPIAIVTKLLYGFILNL